jgi:hypothetical protein
MTDKEDIYEKRLEVLREMLEVQCSDGNWNFDPYMHGMANGMIYALSILEDEIPVFMEAPEEWGKDTMKRLIPCPSEETEESGS